MRSTVELKKQQYTELKQHLLQLKAQFGSKQKALLQEYEKYDKELAQIVVKEVGRFIKKCEADLNQLRDKIAAAENDIKLLKDKREAQSLGNENSHKKIGPFIKSKVELFTVVQADAAGTHHDYDLNIARINSEIEKLIESKNRTNRTYTLIKKYLDDFINTPDIDRLTLILNLIQCKQASTILELCNKANTLNVAIANHKTLFDEEVKKIHVKLKKLKRKIKQEKNKKLSQQPAPTAETITTVVKPENSLIEQASDWVIISPDTPVSVKTLKYAKQELLNLIDNIKSYPQHAAAKDEKYDILHKMADAITRAPLETVAQIKTAAKNFFFLCLQRNHFGMSNTTNSGEFIVKFLSAYYGDHLRIVLFGAEAVTVEYSDLRALICNGENNKSLFNRSNRESNFSLWKKAGGKVACADDNQISDRVQNFRK